VFDPFGRKLRRGESVAVWTQSEVGPLESSKPSPVFVHQFQEAVKATAALLERHRTDQSPAVPPHRDSRTDHAPSKGDHTARTEPQERS
jgi:hypothetical protein